MLTGLSGFWFARTKHIVARNHLLALRGTKGDPPSADGWRCSRLECVVRGYITGSGWKDYVASGEVWDIHR